MVISHYNEDQYPSISNLTQPALVNDFGWNKLFSTLQNVCVSLIAHEVIKLVLTSTDASTSLYPALTKKTHSYRMYIANVSE